MRNGRARHLRSALVRLVKNTRRAPAYAPQTAVNARTGQARHETLPRSSWARLPAAAWLGLAFTFPPASALRANGPLPIPHTAVGGTQGSRQNTGDVAAHEVYSELFAEWLSLAGAKSIRDITTATPPINKNDALIVIDMQCDFVPASKSNPDGGRFGVADGDAVTEPICSLIKAASDVGATIIASRDYHPHDHCSFASEGGGFPSHCVQGTAGAKLLPAIATALEEAMQANGASRTLVAFKAMHEHVDSFGALPYAKEPFGEGRVTKSAQAEPEGLGKGDFSKYGAIMGCSQAPWTGSLVLKQSAIAAADDDEDGREDSDMYDANAPPDVLAMVQDGVDRKLRTMQDVLAQNLCPRHGRIFVCGLALDFCVHDTCVNAVALGMQRVSIILDAARAAHIPGVGVHGSGFLSEPSKVRSSLASAGVHMASVSSVLPQGYHTHAITPDDAALGFPLALGPLGLKKAPVHMDLALSEVGTGTYSLKLSGVLAPLARLNNFNNVGIISPSVPLSKGWPGLSDAERARATRLCWAYPLQGITPKLGSQVGQAFLAVSVKPELSFAAYGGFLLLDDAGNIVQAQAVGDVREESKAMHFEAPQEWAHAELLASLEQVCLCEERQRQPMDDQRCERGEGERVREEHREGESARKQRGKRGG